jgi:hypothetical protein
MATLRAVAQRPWLTWRLAVSLFLGLLFIFFAWFFLLRPEALQINQPQDGALIHQPFVTVSGVSRPGATIMRDVPIRVDPVITQADENGLWECDWYLSPGENTVRLYTEGTGNHKDLTVHYTGSQQWDGSVLITGCSTRGLLFPGQPWDF